MKYQLSIDIGNEREIVNGLGFYAALVACVANAGYCISQILQISGILKSPADAILIYGFSFCIAVPFLLAILALHYSVSPGKKIWSHAALLFAVIYVIYVMLNYTVQLTAVIPYTNPDPVLIQTPHSLCWTLDALGYIFMGLATLVIVPVFENTGYEKWLRWFLIANGVMIPIISLVYFYPHFSNALLMLASPWMVTTTGSLYLLMLFFKRQSKFQKQNESQL